MEAEERAGSGNSFPNRRITATSPYDTGLRMCRTSGPQRWRFRKASTPQNPSERNMATISSKLRPESRAHCRHLRRAELEPGFSRRAGGQPHGRLLGRPLGRYLCSPTCRPGKNALALNACCLQRYAVSAAALLPMVELSVARIF